MSFTAELKRRNVIRVGIAYIIVGWVLAQIAEFAFENFGAPAWVLKSVVVVLLLGLPLAQLPELLVTARTSAFSFKGQNIPIQEIAAALGVNHIVEGSYDDRAND